MTRTQPTLAISLIIAALGVIACGDDGEGGGARGGPGRSADSGSADVSRGEPITDFVEYVGGNAGPADMTLEPITVGWVNIEGGALSFPEATRTAEATVRYVNEELGGIDGHPLELRTCLMRAVEDEGQRCGQQLVNDDDVVAIVFGLVVIGNESLHAQIAGSKPVFMGVAGSPIDATAENTYALFGSLTSAMKPFGTFARDVLKAKTAAIVFQRQPAMIAVADATKQGLRAAGIKVRSVGYDMLATDLRGPITAAGGQKADVLIPVTDVPGCINVAKSLEQAGIDARVLSAPLCLSAPVAEGFGGAIPGWTYGVAQDIPSDLSNPTVKAYNDAVTRHLLKPADATSLVAAAAFAELLAVVKLMNEVGAEDLTPQAVTEQAQDFAGPVVMGPPEIECGTHPGEPAVCNDRTQFYDYAENETYELASGWLKPPR